MTAPTFDRSGYPTGGTLADLRTLPWTVAAVEFLDAAWNHDYGGAQTILDEELHLATGGWSGNEDVISALMESPFWAQGWQSSHRGGLYVFRMPPT